MTNKELLDLYSDYLISSFGQVTGTGMAALLEGSISHDRIQRALSQEQYGSAELWRVVKPHIRKLESNEGILIVDDSIAEKPYTDENELICWHWDHTKQRSVKGINFVSAVYHQPGAQAATLPIGYQLIAKTERYVDPKSGKEKRRSPKSKNECYRELLQQAVANQIKFAYVTNDTWFAAAENMRFVKQTLEKDFVMPLKDNRKVALSLQDKQAGRYVRVDSLTLSSNSLLLVYLEGVEFPLHLAKQVFTNEDGSTGILYLVTSDLTLTYDRITTIYQKRWNIEPYHKSLKQNASLEKSPTHTVTTQSNHFFAAICAYVKLELLKLSTKLNHFALRAKLYLKAIQTAFNALNDLKPPRLAA
jgi:DDE superfamily endonuclease